MTDSAKEVRKPQDDSGEDSSRSDDKTIIDPDSQSIPVPRSFQQFLGMFAGQLPRRDPLIEKLDAEGMKQLLTQGEKSDERDHTRQMHHMYLLAGLGVIAMTAILGLCWLFLSYQKSDQVEKIIALIVGLVGGFGIGRGTAPKITSDKD